MASQIRVTYAGNMVEDLTSVIYRVTNTGNSVIKNQFLRFVFPERARILEAYLDPVPEPELGVTEIGDAKQRPQERRFGLAHLEVGQSVGFRFLSDGGDWAAWTGVFPFNDEGGVDFQRRDIARARADQEHIRPFFVYLILLLVLPPAFSLSILPATEVVRLTVALVLIGLLVRHLLPVARLVERMIMRYFDSEGSIVQARTINGNVHFYPTAPGEKKAHP